MLRKLCALVCLAGLAVAPLAAAEDGWVSIGPWGGSVASLVVNSRDPRILYAGTVGGLFKSSDGGLSWVDVHGDLPHRTVQALAISPSTPGTLYVAVGSYTDSYGVFHSTDGGASWQGWQSGFGGFPQIDALAVHPRDPKIAVASAHVSLFKTTDGGVKWTRIATGNLLVQVEALVFHPSQPATLYGGSAHGVIKSTDGGSSWASASTGLGDTPVHAILLEPGKPGTLYAGTSAGVFVSTDAAGHWQPAGTGLTGRKVLALAVSRAGGGLPVTLWAGTETGAFRSRNGGASWVPASLGLRNQRIAALAVHPTAPRVLWAASGEAQQITHTPGLFKSVNGGDRWRVSNQGISAQFVTRFAVDPESPGGLWAGVSFGGVWHSTDGGATWTERSRGLGALDFVNDLVIDPREPKILWLGTDQGLFRTADGGANWESRGNGLVDSAGERVRVFAVRLDPRDPQVVLLGTSQSFFRSIDEGTTWTHVPFNEFGEAFIPDVLIDPRDPDVLVATPGGGLSRSTDGGLTWTPAADIPGGYPSLGDLARDPADPERIVVGGDRSWISVSHDGGQTWTLVPTPSFSGTIMTLAIDPVDGSIWAGGRIQGIHQVREDGSPQSPPLKNVIVLDLQFDPDDPHVLYAAVFDRGILKHVRPD